MRRPGPSRCRLQGLGRPDLLAAGARRGRSRSARRRRRGSGTRAAGSPGRSRARTSRNRSSPASEPRSASARASRSANVGQPAIGSTRAGEIGVERRRCQGRTAAAPGTRGAGAAARSAAAGARRRPPPAPRRPRTWGTRRPRARLPARGVDGDAAAAQVLGHQRDRDRRPRRRRRAARLGVDGQLDGGQQRGVDRVDPPDVAVGRDVRPEGRPQLVRLLDGDGLGRPGHGASATWRGRIVRATRWAARPALPVVSSRCIPAR